jgi:hypothetical protein
MNSITEECFRENIFLNPQQLKVTVLVTFLNVLNKYQQKNLKKKGLILLPVSEGSVHGCLALYA